MKIKAIGIAVQLLISGPLFLHGGAEQNGKTFGVDLWKQSEQFYTSCLSQSEKIGLDEDVAYFSQKLAAVNLELGQFSNALDHVEKALMTYGTLDQALTETRLHTVDTHILKARLLGFLGQYAEAVGELLMVFEENCAIRGELDLETTRLYKHLGWHLGRLGKKGGTLHDLTNFSSELSLLESHLNGLDATTPLTVPFLAQKCYERALSSDKKTLGEIHPDTAKSYSLIGWILGDQEKYSEALEYHMQALEIRLKCYSEIHPDVARSYSHIGWNYEKLGNYVKARQNYEMALRIKEKVLPQGHPELEEDKENLHRVSIVRLP